MSQLKTKHREVSLQRVMKPALARFTTQTHQHDGQGSSGMQVHCKEAERMPPGAEDGAC